MKKIQSSLLFALGANFFSTLILIPLRKEKIVFSSTIVGALINIILNVFLLPSLSFTGAAFTTLLAECIVCVLLVIKAKDEMKYDYLISFKDMLRIIAGLVVEAVIIILINGMVDNNIIRVVACIMSAIIAYGIVLISLKESIVDSLLHRRKTA